MGKSCILQPLIEPVTPEDSLDDKIGRHRTQMQHEGGMALLGLIWVTLDHASMAISHPGDTLSKIIEMARSKTIDEWVSEVKAVIVNLKVWAESNPCKVTFMVMGLGGTAFKAKAIAQCMLDAAKGFCMWSRGQTLFVRFWGFVALMSIRLVVSTLVPPTSPGFGIIIQAATPDEQKWTAMPCFLAASAIAGAWPWVFDKLLQCFTGKDFYFTMAAKRFADTYPLTCWTGPAMKEAFRRLSGGEGEENSKLAASSAVVVGHVVPFMGAQTTIMQRYFLPHPADTIVSQPFGMTEDLVSMAMAEAISNPVLASASLTALIVFFNLARGLVFSTQRGQRLQQQQPHSSMNDDVTGNDIEAPPTIPSVQSFEHQAVTLCELTIPSYPIQSLEHQAAEHPRDYAALTGAALNVQVGLITAHILSQGMSFKVSFCAVVFQMMIQLFIVPIMCRCTSKLLEPKVDDVADSVACAPQAASPKQLETHAVQRERQAWTLVVPEAQATRAGVRSSTAHEARDLLKRDLQLISEESSSFTVDLGEDSDLFKWHVAFEGPIDSLYEGARFSVFLVFSQEFPYAPPETKFKTEMWHPNIYPDGRVCNSLLHAPGTDPFDAHKYVEQRRPIHNVRRILMSLTSVLVEPNLNSPVNIDAATHMKNHPDDYKKQVQRMMRRSLEA